MSAPEQAGEQAVHALARQYGFTIPPTFARMLARAVLTASSTPTPLLDAAARIDLPARRAEVLPMVARCWETDEIAAMLLLSRDTVKRHVYLLQGDLAARNRTHVGSIAVALGLVPAEAVVPSCLLREAS